jgi:GT2 family glycosyltransferase
MKSAIAILTFRRLPALQAMMRGVEDHCAFYPCAIFEDCGQRDGTESFLKKGRQPKPRPELMATEWDGYSEVTGVDTAENYKNARVFLADRNLGVAGQSNRAIHWFLNETDCDHLCLCNDDLLVTGDFVGYYAKAHEDLGVGLFCFCDFDKASPAISGNPESYRWTTYPWRGYKVKMLPRFTGIMMSMTRPLLQQVGYFDAAFGKFGEEHCDFTIRCRLAGGIKFDGQDMNCLDVETDTLKHQDVQTSFTGAQRKHADAEASAIMQQAAQSYRYRHYYRPFRLVQPSMVGGYRGGGIPFLAVEEMGYKLVTAMV